MSLHLSSYERLQQSTRSFCFFLAILRFRQALSDAATQPHLYKESSCCSCCRVCRNLFYETILPRGTIHGACFRGWKGCCCHWRKHGNRTGDSQRTQPKRSQGEYS
ncbi:hypothetical protein PMAYCL1PPCAC_11080, partial [Pristionchus mayeri]